MQSIVIPRHTSFRDQDFFISFTFAYLGYAKIKTFVTSSSFSGILVLAGMRSCKSLLGSVVAKTNMKVNKRKQQKITSPINRSLFVASPTLPLPLLLSSMSVPPAAFPKKLFPPSSSESCDSLTRVLKNTLLIRVVVKDR